MKKIYLPFIALMALLFAVSCQMQEPASGNLAGEVDFSISAGIPGGTTTYSPEDGTAFSHNGGASNVKPDAYDLRYILEIYDGEALAYRDEKVVKENFTAEGVTFNARLLAKKYNVVLWADFVKEVDADVQASDLYYATSALKNIQYTSEVSITPGILATDAADAYYTSFEMNLTESSQSMKDVKLKRPFGKMRFIAADKLSDGVNQSERPASVIMDFGGAEVPSSFNALTGEASGSLAIGQLAFTAVQENAWVKEETKSGAYLLGYTYFFASNSSSSAYPVDITVFSDESTTNQIGKRSVSSVPVQENKLTTVIGNFYTNDGSIDVIVEDKFGEEETHNLPETVEVGSLAAAQDYIKNFATDPSSAEKDVVITIPGKLAEGDNGDKLELPQLSNNVTLVLENGISDNGLTIEDVLISSGSGNDFTGKLILKNNSTDSQGALEINLPAGSCELQGSVTYSSIVVTTAENTLVVGEDATVKSLTVKGGNVKIFGTVDPGSITVENEGSKIYWGAGTEARLREVLGYAADKNHGVILTADVVCESIDVNNGAQANQDGFKIGGSSINSSNDFVKNPYDGYMFDGNGHSLSGAAYNNIMAVYANGVTVKNLEIFQTNEPKKANAGISIYRVNEVALENVNVHDCGKAGVIINASQVSAKALVTDGNAWGAVNVSKGGAPTGGPRPEFTFDASCRFNEAVKVYVDLDRTGEDYAVMVPNGWKSYKLGTQEFYIPAEDKFMIPAGTDLSSGGIFAANTAYYLQAGEYANSILIDQPGVELIGDGNASDVVVNNSIFVNGNDVTVRNMTVVPKSNDGIYTENKNDITFTVKDVVVDMKNRPSGTAIRISEASGVTLNVEGCNLIIPKNSMRGVNFYDLTDGKCVLNMDRTHVGPKAEVMGIGYYNDEQNSVFKGLSDTRGIGLGAGGTEMEINVANSVIEGVYYAVNIIPAATATVKFNMENSTLDGRCAFNLWARNENNINEYVVRNSNLVGRNPFGGPTEEFATIVFNFGMGSGFSEPKNNHVIIENSGIYCYNNPETDTNTQFAADMRSWDTNTLELKGNTVIYDRSNSSRLEYAVVVNSDNTCNVDETVQFLDKNGKEKGKPIVHYK